MGYASLEAGRARVSRVMAVDEVWRSRLPFLEERDRIALELWLDNKASGRQIAQLMRVHPGTIHRRLRAFMKNSRHPIVEVVCDPRTEVTPRARQVGLLHYLLGHSKAAIARRIDCSILTINAELSYLNGFVRAGDHE